MERYVTNRILVALTIGSLCLMGYTVTYALAGADPEYDLTIDNIPVIFSGNKTLYLDTQTNDRGFLIYNDHLKIRSQYLTFYELNNSYEHEDVNYVIGGYCYTPIPAQNATLDTIVEINRFQLSSWNGTVTVGCTEYGTSRMVLQVNSTDNATLLIRAVELHRNYEYRVLVDDSPVAWLRVNDGQYIEYNYTGDWWSNHTITFQQYGEAIEVPSQYLYLLEIMLCLGVVAVVVKAMVLPVVKNKPVSNEVYVRVAIKAMFYIIVALVMITLVFKLFVGV